MLSQPALSILPQKVTILSSYKDANKTDIKCIALYIWDIEGSAVGLQIDINTY
jgi:hypothetical protein